MEALARECFAGHTVRLVMAGGPVGEDGVPNGNVFTRMSELPAGIVQGVFVSLSLYVSLCLCASVSLCVSLCLCASARLSVRLSVSLCLSDTHTHTHTHTHTERERE